MNNVTPVIGSIGMYYVDSASSHGVRHLVDLLECACGCADWTCRQREYRHTTGKPYRCRHILAAREYALDDLLEVMKEASLSK